MENVEKKGIFISLGIVLLGNVIKSDNGYIGNLIQGFGLGTAAGTISHVIDKQIHTSVVIKTPHHDVTGLALVPVTFVLDKNEIIKNKDITSNLYGFGLGLVTQHLVTEGCSFCNSYYCKESEDLC